MEVNSKAAEFEAEAMARLARIKLTGKTLKAASVKKWVCRKISRKGATKFK